MKKATLPHQHDSMGDFINPTHGYRGELTKKGIKPKNHMKDNVQELRMKQMKLKQEKDEKELAENRAKQLYKLPQFQNVESRLYGGDSAREHSPSSARRTSFDENTNENRRFLTRGLSEVRREELIREKKLIRQELEMKLEEERALAEKPSTPRKASVPRANEVAPLAAPSNANFIHRNKVSAITMQPSKRIDDDGSVVDKHDEFGKVPQYLEERKARWAAEEEERKRRLPDPDCPPGMCLMPESERLETLRVLQESREEALNQLRKLPFVIETPSMKKKQEFLENKLREIDRALSIFSKPKVYVARDR
eukprot:gene1175-1247_t